MSPPWQSERVRSGAVVSSYRSAQGASLDFVEEEWPFDPFWMSFGSGFAYGLAAVHSFAQFDHI